MEVWCVEDQEFNTEQEAIDYAQTNGYELIDIVMEIIDGNS